MLMQLSIWKKEWDEDKKEYEPVDLSYQPYGYHLVTSHPCTACRARIPARTRPPPRPCCSTRCRAPQTRKWKKLGWLNEKNLLRPEGELIAEGLLTDAEQIDAYRKRQATGCPSCLAAFASPRREGCEGPVLRCCSNPRICGRRRSPRCARSIATASTTRRRRRTRLR